MASGFVFPRTVILVEIVRRCLFADCNRPTSIALTKDEANDYRGFDCSHCERWNEDQLKETDVPEWWAEIHKS